MLRPGRVAKERRIGPVRELTRVDLDALREPRPKGSAAKRFRDSHHRVAVLFAEGLRATQVMAMTGYSHNRVCQLIADPTFKELIASYRADAHTHLRENLDEFRNLSIGNMVEAELQLEEVLASARDSEEPLAVRELVAITADRADRFGYGKHQTNTNVNVDFAKSLDAAVKRTEKVITGEALQQVSPPRPAAQDRGTPSHLAVAEPHRTLPRPDITNLRRRFG